MIVPLQTSTFQAIVVTDNIQTFTVFTYVCGSDGTTNFLSPGNYRYAVVGYNAFGLKLDNHQLSAMRVVDVVSCVNYQFESCGETSNLVYQLSIGADERQMAKKDCLRLLDEDRKKNPDFRSLENLEPEPCPCSFWQAWRDRGRFRWAYPDYWCFFQVQPQIISEYTFTQQCCYKFYTSPR